MDFKIACLRDIAKLFPRGGASPFYAGFGNRDTDVISYSSVGVPEGKIFVINPSGEIQIQNVGVRKSYHSLVEVVDAMFPSVGSWKNHSKGGMEEEGQGKPKGGKKGKKAKGQDEVVVPEDFNAKNFWVNPNPYNGMDIDDLLDE